MSSIHVLCAPPNGRNPGMTAVDRAFLPVGRHLGADVTFWRMWDVSEWRELGGAPLEPGSTVVDDFNGIDYRLLRSNLPEFLDADAVVYWGDFLHMQVYLDMTVDVLDRRIGLAGSDPTVDWVKRCLLGLGEPDEQLDRTVTFGTTLSMNSAEDYASRYQPELRDFVRRTRRAWFRDPYSAAVAQLYRDDPEENCKGVDAAMLLPPTESVTADESMAVFLGRSSLAPEWVGRFGARLARQLRLSPRWLHWGDSPAFWPMRDSRRLRLAWPGLELGSSTPGALDRARARVGVLRGAMGELSSPAPFEDLLARIAAAALVVTDTYHLAVLAWRAGTPAVCITDQASPGGWSVNEGRAGSRRDKRIDLYSQLDVMPLLADSTQAPGAEADRIARVLREDSEVVRQGVQRLESGARRSAASLVDALSTLLA